MRILSRRALLLAALLHLLPPAFAEPIETFERSGDIEIHFNALRVTDLPPESARSYGLTRSPTHGLVTLAALRRGGDAQPPTPLPARVSLSFSSLTSAPQAIDLREIREGSAIYYLGSFRLSGGQDLTFRARVLVDGSSERDLVFRRSF